VTSRMSVRGTRKRIEALESALPPSAQPDGLDDETVRAALELVSMEDLRALRRLRFPIVEAAKGEDADAHKAPTSQVGVTTGG
jgi:hypothetical protein